MDGFDLKFTHRGSWKAERHKGGKFLDIVPVTWTKGLRFKEKLLEVWYQDPTEMETRRTSREPFAVAMAEAKDFSKFPHEFLRFTGVFEVIPTGHILDKNSIETSMIRRISAKESV